MKAMKKAISMLLCLVLCLSLFPVQVFADDAEADDWLLEESYDEEVNETDDDWEDDDVWSDESLDVFYDGFNHEKAGAFATSGYSNGEQADRLVEIMSAQHGEVTHNDKGEHIQCARYVAYAAKKAGMTEEQIHLKTTGASPWSFKKEKCFNFINSDGSTNYGCQVYTWKDFKEGRYTPVKGDIVFYGRYSTANYTIEQLVKETSKHSGNHVGVIRNNSSTINKLYTVEGNTSLKQGDEGIYTNAQKTRSFTNGREKSGKVQGWPGVYITYFVRPNYEGSSNYEEYQYMTNNCTELASYADLIVKAPTTLKTLPCSRATNAASEDVETISVGTPIVATGLVWNGSNYWYKTIYDGSKEAYKNHPVYIFAGHVTATPLFDGDASLTDNPQIPKGEQKKAELDKKGYTLTGTIKLNCLELDSVGCYIGRMEPYPSVVRQSALYEIPEDKHLNSWGMQTKFPVIGSDGKEKQTSLDDSCKFGKLDVGEYTFMVYATVRNNIATSGTTVEKRYDNVVVASSIFSVVSDDLYTLTYDPNYYDLPVVVKAKAGSAITLRDAASLGMRKEGYAFAGWSRDENAKAASFQPFDEFVLKNDEKLYAVWIKNVVTLSFDANGGSGSMGSVCMKVGDEFNIPESGFSRSGYTFSGFQIYCPYENKWYTVEKGWLSTDEVETGNYEKRLFNKASVIRFDLEWLKGVCNATDYILFAQWEEDEITGTTGNLEWSYINGTLQITGSGQMPDYLSNGADVPWNEIHGNIERVIIGEGITSIGEYAFDFGTIREVSLPRSLRSINKGAFTGTGRLTEITLPEGLLSIGERAFQDSGLKSLLIPSTVERISVNRVMYSDESLGSPFLGCPLASIRVAPGNQYFCAENNALMTIDKSRLIVGAVVNGEYHVPDGVQVIEGAAFFQKCAGMTKLYLPEGLVKIETHAFWGCQNLTEIHTNSLDNVSFPNSLWGIGGSAFDGCTALQYLFFDKSSTINYIDSCAFGGCRGMRTMVFPVSLQSVGDYAFENFGNDVYADDDTKVVFSSFASIGSKAFENAGYKNGVAVPVEVPSWTGTLMENIDGNLTFIKVKTHAYTFHYHANGGTGAPEDGTDEEVVATPGKIFIIFEVPEKIPERPGYDFLGWEDPADNTDAIFLPGEYDQLRRTPETTDVVLYAVWSKHQDLTEDYVLDLFDSTVGSVSVTQLAGSTEMLNSGKTAVQLAYEVYFSEEFLAKNYCTVCWTDALYNGLLGRSPSPDEFEEIEEKLDYDNACWEEIFNDIVTGEEFIARCQNAGITVGGPIDVPVFGTYSTGLCTDPDHEESAEHVCTLAYAEAYDAGCIEPGLAAHYYCEECGALYADAQGHTRISEHSLITGLPFGHTYDRGFCIHCGEMDEDAVFCAVRYDANGGPDEPETQYRLEGEELTLSTMIPAWGDYTFLGWAPEPDARAAVYQPGDLVTLDDDMDLYAVWTAYLWPYASIGGTFSVEINGVSAEADSDGEFMARGGDSVAIIVKPDERCHVADFSASYYGMNQYGEIDYTVEETPGRVTYRFIMPPCRRTYVSVEIEHPGYKIYCSSIRKGNEPIVSIALPRYWAEAGEIVPGTITKADFITVDSVTLFWWDDDDELYEQELELSAGGAFSFTMPDNYAYLYAECRVTGYDYAIDRSALPESAMVELNDISNAVADTANAGDLVYVYFRDGNPSDLTVTTQDGQNVPVTDGSFIMPASNVAVTVDASFTIFDNTFNNGSTGSVRVAVNGEETAMRCYAKEGDHITLIAKPADGYSVTRMEAVYWHGKGDFVRESMIELTRESADTWSFTMPPYSVGIMYSFAQGAVIHFEANGGEGSMAEEMSGVSEKYTLPMCLFSPPDEEVFIAWKVKDTLYRPGDVIEIEGDTVVSAQWGIPSFGEADFVLPGALSRIEDNAFEGIAATIIEIPEGCCYIGANAFKDCPNLVHVRLPDSVDFIDDTAFEGCRLVYLFGTGGLAYDYCADHLNCIFVDED